MEMLHRLLTQLLLVSAMIYYCQAKSLGAAETGDTVWEPENRTKSEWLSCRGMPKGDCDRANSKYKMLQDVLGLEHGIDNASSSPGPNGQSPDGAPSQFPNNGEGACIWWTEEQMDIMLAEAQYRKDIASGKRKKRTLVDLKKYPTLKWSLPIYYKFDGTQPDSDKRIIRNAFQHWMDNTCIRFNELPTGAPYSNNHIILTSQAAGCYSYVGKSNYIPQPINLYSSCLYRFGTPVHEIGHTLGLYHEQMRRDRDSSIDIIWQNIYDSYYSQFSLVEGTDGLGLPYNYGSVMHYSSKEAISKNGRDTMIAKQPLYQMNMGQRTGLSFHDAKLMNLAYCQGVCTRQLSQPCQRGGYQNPKDCSRCICPDGFSGTYCETIAPPKYENCGGVLNMNPNSQQIITSPGYNDRRFYFSKQECTWWIKAPQNSKLQLTFDGDFGIYCEFGACYHWVEIKYKKDLGDEGGRFCCYDRPQVAIVSESNEMMVIFKSNYTVDYYAAQRGFRAIVKTIPITSGDNVDDSNIRKSSSGSSMAPQIRTTPASALEATARTASRGSQNTLWQCSFDTSSSGDNLCGMKQDTTDDFDWTVFHDPTPSDPTGPDSPFDGYNYIFIEASSPRQPNDEARLFVPNLNFEGDVCVDFYYHMYGFHINTLKLVRITNNQSVVVWMRSKEIGNVWLHATATVNLSKDSQLQFIGIRGDEFSGDIGLDKILVRSGACSN